MGNMIYTKKTKKQRKIKLEKKAGNMIRKKEQWNKMIKNSWSPRIADNV